MEIIVSLGTSEFPVTNFMGIGFELHQQASIFALESIIWHDFPGTENQVIRFNHVFPGTANYGFSVSRNDSSGASGFGQVASIRLVAMDTPTNEYGLEIQNVMAITTSGETFDVGIPPPFGVIPSDDDAIVPAQVYLMSPVNAAIDVPIQPELHWQEIPQVNYYELMITDDPLFENLHFEMTSMHASVTVTETLLHETMYFWRVRAMNDAGPGEWSETWNFTTIPIIGAFALATPIDGLSFIFEGATSETLDITWEHASIEIDEPVHYTWYFMETGKDTSEALVRYLSNNSGTLTTLTLSYETIDIILESLGMNVNTTRQFEWTVGASVLESVRLADVSFVLNITRGTLTSLHPSESQIPTAFELFQNYPNPFNPSTSIGYAVPDDRHVKVSIFDVMGRHIITLVDEVHGAGSYSVVWNAHDTTTGTYIYRISSDLEVHTKKMLLIK